VKIPLLSCRRHYHIELVPVAGLRATSDRLEAEFVCIPRPAVRASGADGGKLRYRVRHEAMLWKAGDRPALRQTIVEGNPALSI